MRRQVLWTHAIICAATFSIAAPAATYAGNGQPPAHAQSDKSKDKKEKDKDKDKDEKDKKDKGQPDPRGHARGHGNAREWNPRFRGLDKNNNHVVSRSEWDGDDRSFANHDWNRDGLLSGDELVAGATRPDPRGATPIAPIRTARTRIAATPRATAMAGTMSPTRCCSPAWTPTATTACRGRNGRARRQTSRGSTSTRTAC
jgi:hypothetical protein